MSNSNIKQVVFPPCPPGYDPTEWYNYQAYLYQEQNKKIAQEEIDHGLPVLGVVCILFLPGIAFIWGLVAAALGRKYATKLACWGLISCIFWWCFMACTGVR